MIPIVTEEVSRSFGTNRAVNAVSVEVDEGEVVALVGPNGSGKTTLIRLMLGLLVPSGGRVRLFGEEPSPEGQRRVGYVPQGLGLYRDLTARENLEFRASCYGVLPATVAGNPGGHGSELVRSMPLGERRRLSFRVATQHRPDLLILDEPTSGVSPLARARLWDQIADQADRGAGVVVSTHYMEEARRADRVVLMSGGSVVAEGSVAEIIGTSTVVEVRSGDWVRALDCLDGLGGFVMLAGRTLRVVGVGAATVGEELDRAGIEGSIATVPASLDEIMVMVNQ